MLCLLLEEHNLTNKVKNAITYYYKRRYPFLIFLVSNTFEIPGKKMTNCEIWGPLHSFFLS